MGCSPDISIFQYKRSFEYCFHNIYSCTISAQFDANLFAFCIFLVEVQKLPAKHLECITIFSPANSSAQATTLNTINCKFDRQIMPLDWPTTLTTIFSSKVRTFPGTNSQISSKEHVEEPVKKQDI